MRDELALDLPEVVLQLRVGHVVVGALLEVHRRDLHLQLSPASTSATCSTRVLASPFRRSRPSMLRMHPRSPSTTASAPLAAMFRHLLSASRADISPNLIEKVPPKLQQVSHSAISASCSPGTSASSSRGWRLTPISRNPEQQSW